MNKTLLAAAIVIASAALLPGAPIVQEAHAAGGIQRCQAADGSTVYTDKSCAAFDAEPVPMPGELLARLDDAQEAETSALMSVGGYVDASLPITARGTIAAGGRRSTADGCARTPTQLAMDLQGAFALGDVNRIAESYHWVGMGQQQAMPIMQRLERLGRQPVLDTHYYDATITSSGIGSWAAAGNAIGSGAGILQLTLGGDGSSDVVDFEVARYTGCYFVSF